MKFSNLSLLFLAAFESALADISACKMVPSSCALLPTYSAEICSDIIESKKLTLKSCFIPTETKTITLTKSATIKSTTVITATTTTETTTSTISKKVTKTLPTIGVLFKTETISSTWTSVVLTTLPKVGTKTEAVTVTTTIPATKTATTTSTWAQQVCEAGGQKLRLRRSRLEGRDPLPMNCYCYLTSTSTSASTISKTIAITQSTTTTITKITGGKAAILTKTLVIKETETVPTTVAAVTQISTTVTKTIKAKFTETSTKTKFSLTTVTSQLTKTATTKTIPVSTVQVNPCGPTAYGRVEIDQPGAQGEMVSSVVSLTGSTNVNKDCCNACYNALGCVYWAIGKSDGSCRTFKAKQSAGCSTSQCPNGFPEFVVSGKDTSYSYFAGPCGSGKTQG